MGVYNNVEVMLDVKQTGSYGARHKAKDEGARHWRIREGHVVVGRLLHRRPGCFLSNTQPVEGQ